VAALARARPDHGLQTRGRPARDWRARGRPDRGATGQGAADRGATVQGVPPGSSGVTCTTLGSGRPDRGAAPMDAVFSSSDHLRRRLSLVRGHNFGCPARTGGRLRATNNRYSARLAETGAEKVPRRDRGRRRAARRSSLPRSCSSRPRGWPAMTHAGAHRVSWAEAVARSSSPPAGREMVAEEYLSGSRCARWSPCGDGETTWGARRVPDHDVGTRGPPWFFEEGYLGSRGRPRALDHVAGPWGPRRVVGACHTSVICYGAWRRASGRG